MNKYFRIGILLGALGFSVAKLRKLYVEYNDFSENRAMYYCVILIWTCILIYILRELHIEYNEYVESKCHIQCTLNQCNDYTKVIEPVDMIHDLMDKLNLNNDVMNNLSHSYGMSYNIADEKKIMKTIWCKTIEEIAEYADIVTRKYHNDPIFLEQQFSMITDDIVITQEMLNPTSIGNIAYIAVHSPAPYNFIVLNFFKSIIASL